MATSEARIEVMRNAELIAGAPTPGIRRRRAFDQPGVLVSQSEIGPGVVSDWHHHAKRWLYGYLAQGELRFDFGSQGRKSVQFSAGDYFRIPPALIHRDVNPSATSHALVIAVLVGEGPGTVNTAGPEPS
jgi:uncharacterized RmlC-like cupin family protein